MNPWWMGYFAGAGSVAAIMWIAVEANDRIARRREKIKNNREPETQKRDIERDGLLSVLDEILKLTQGQSWLAVEKNAHTIISLDKALERHGLGLPLGIGPPERWIGYYLPLRSHLEVGIQEAQEWRQRTYIRQESRA